ncbi:hypothetical protein D0T49_01215 [Paludibacter sp. 221]|uniref:hypothetical protein n=1 Tax=Paludibacter sp. 221 TaxID=2302939 RepID=UPI0013D3CC0E|nr:hypothetical protein [Paludibacter sp. 221]NDV45670.1 hypothetical protein [Paludibacter sp. 221]
MRLFYTILLFLSISALSIQANTVTDYFDNCRKTGNADYSTGQKIVKDFDTPGLLNALDKYYADTLTFVRQQAYYLTYRKGLDTKEDVQPIVVRLAKGINDDDGGLRGRIIGYLKSFPLTAFNEESKALIAANINKPNSPHYDELVLLAGFVGTGNNDLFRLSMNSELPTRRKWNISLALARLGSADALQSCLEKVKKAPVNSGMVAYLLPDLVYTRQKSALDYCVELLHSDEKLCETANPDLSESILCAYPIIELIAPVIVNFPIKVDPSIGLDVDDYEKMLQTVRKWFDENPDYEILVTSY